MAEKRTVAESAQSALSAAKDSKNSAADRIAALAQVAPAVHDDEDNLLALVGILGDKSEPVSVRMAALGVIELAGFSAPAFEKCRGDYMAMLRKVLPDADEELRGHALSILSSEGDGYAQKRLLEGLKDGKKALVPPEQALQLLGYNVHTDVYPVARAIVNKPPNEGARLEALRLLAADASSNKLFEQLLRDKKETPDVRQLCAVALQSIKPDSMYAYAKELLNDDSEDEDLQATCLTALAQFARIGDDDALVKQVQGLKDKGKSKLKKSATQFLKKYDK